MYFSLSFIISFLISLIIIPVIIYLSKKYNIFDKENSRKIHQGQIPRIGGIAIFLGFCFSFIIMVYPNQQFSFNLPLYFIALGIVFFTGLFDDFFNLRARYKLLLQIIAAILLINSGLIFDEINIFNVVSFEFGWLAYPITIFIMLAMINAINLIDGMDGLASGLVFIGNIFIAILAFLTGNNLIALMMIVFAGAILGFYIFNFPGAKIFMGDSGAYLLGFLYSTIPLMQTGETQVIPHILVFALFILVIPLFDIVNVMIIRYKNGLGLFSPDMNHIHHRLMRLGFSTTGILYIVYSYTSILGLFSLIIFYLPSFFSITILVSLFLFICLSMYTVFYAEKVNSQTTYYNVNSNNKYQTSP